MGPHNFKADVAEVFVVLGVAQPTVDDAMTTNECFAPVDDDELAMIAVV